ncbi:MAG: pilus assembly protein [Alphaproteobacteria bacterium]|nr:pilus assembly protein [Alphaproteobacteria bacterium]
MILWLRKHLTAFSADNAGTTAVEFALIAGIFISFIFGIFEMGRAFYTWNGFQYAVENTTRHVLVTANMTESQVEDYILEEMEEMGVDTDDVTLDVTFSTVSDVNFVEVDGTKTHQIFIPLIPEDVTSVDLKAHSRMPIP